MTQYGAETVPFNLGSDFSMHVWLLNVSPFQVHQKDDELRNQKKGQS